MEILEGKARGYREAAKINDKIDELVIELNPHLAINRWFWLTFTRTVRSTLEAIDLASRESAR